MKHKLIALFVLCVFLTSSGFCLDNGGVGILRSKCIASSFNLTADQSSKLDSIWADLCTSKIDGQQANVQIKNMLSSDQYTTLISIRMYSLKSLSLFLQDVQTYLGLSADQITTLNLKYEDYKTAVSVEKKSDPNADVNSITKSYSSAFLSVLNNDQLALYNGALDRALPIVSPKTSDEGSK